MYATHYNKKESFCQIFDDCTIFSIYESLAGYPSATTYYIMKPASI